MKIAIVTGLTRETGKATTERMISDGYFEGGGVVVKDFSKTKVIDDFGF